MTSALTTDRNSENRSAKPHFRILVHEEDEDIRQVYAHFLSGWDATIQDSLSGSLAIIKEHTFFDLIILDGHPSKSAAIIGAIRQIRETEAKEKQLPQQILVSTTDPELYRHALAESGLKVDQSDEHDGLSIGVLEKPFSFVQLLSMLRSRKPRIAKVRMTDHILGIYQDPDAEIHEAISFLQRAFKNNETALLLIGTDYDIAEVKAKMRANGVSDLEEKLGDGSLIIMRNEDWYVPDKKMDKQKVAKQWLELVDSCKKAGRNGLAAFCMMDCVFDHGCGGEVAEYEGMFEGSFKVPLVAICAYRKADIEKLPEDHKRKLVMAHNYVWASEKRKTARLSN